VARVSVVVTIGSRPELPVIVIAADVVSFIVQVGVALSGAPEVPVVALVSARMASIV